MHPWKASELQMLVETSWGQMLYSKYSCAISILVSFLGWISLGVQEQS